MNRRIPSLTWLASLTLIGLVSCTQAPVESPEAARWWGHVVELANDDMEGRNTGSAGYDRAAAYVADEFARYGAIPGNGDSFLQTVEFTSRKIVEDQSSLELIRDGEATSLTLGEHANFSVNLAPAKSVEADLVFVGYGMTIPEIGHDDFANVDVRGKVIVYTRGAPKALTGPLRAHMQSSRERWKVHQAAGAIGSMYLPNPKFMDVPWERSTLRRLEARMTLADPEYDAAPGKQVSISVNPEHADMLFEGTGHTFDELMEYANNEEALPTFALPHSMRGKLEFEVENLKSPNVVGIIEGSDPELKNEYVVLSGHLDGLGVGGAVDGDRIYNGAIDNASGIATMIEIARMMQEEGVELKRSLILLAVTGEEKGLRGSEYFARNPTVDGRIVACINMDMYMPIIPFEHLITYGIDESDLGDLMPGLAEKYGVSLMPDPAPDRNIFVRSDQYSFIKTGVPSLSFKFGAVADSEDDALLKAWLKERYHAPSDDLDQPVDKEAAVAFTKLLKDLCTQVANADERPRWKDDSFFKRFAVDEPVAQAGN